MGLRKKFNNLKLKLSSIRNKVLDPCEIKEHNVYVLRYYNLPKDFHPSRELSLVKVVRLTEDAAYFVHLGEPDSPFYRFGNYWQDYRTRWTLVE